MTMMVFGVKSDVLQYPQVIRLQMRFPISTPFLAPLNIVTLLSKA